MGRCRSFARVKPKRGMMVYCSPTPRAMDLGIWITRRKSSKLSVNPMLSMMMPRKRGIHVGWNHVAVVGSQRERQAPPTTQAGKKFASVMKNFSTRLTGWVFAQ